MYGVEEATAASTRDRILRVRRVFFRTKLFDSSVFWIEAFPYNSGPEHDLKLRS